MRKVTLEAFEHQKLPQELQTQEFKDNDLLLGYGLTVGEEINDLYHKLERHICIAEKTNLKLSDDDIDNLLDDDRWDKVEAFLVYKAKIGALARELQRIGLYYEQQTAGVIGKVQRKLAEYKLKNPSWEKIEIQRTEQELKKLYEIEQKFLDKQSQEWRVYQENGTTVHEQMA